MRALRWGSRWSVGRGFRPSAGACKTVVVPDPGRSVKRTSQYKILSAQCFQRRCQSRQGRQNVLLADRTDAEPEPTGIAFDPECLERHHRKMCRFEQVAPDIVVRTKLD